MHILVHCASSKLGRCYNLSYSWHCYAAEMKAPRKILKIWHLYCGSSSSLMILADIDSSEKKQHFWVVRHLSIKTSSSPEYPPPKASKRPLFRAAIWKFTCRTFSHIIKPSTFEGSFGILGSGTKNRYDIKKSFVGKEDKKPGYITIQLIICEQSFSLHLMVMSFPC